MGWVPVGGPNFSSLVVPPRSVLVQVDASTSEDRAQVEFRPFAPCFASASPLSLPWIPSCSSSLAWLSSVAESNHVLTGSAFYIDLFIILPGFRSGCSLLSTHVPSCACQFAAFVSTSLLLFLWPCRLVCSFRRCFVVHFSFFPGFLCMWSPASIWDTLLLGPWVSKSLGIPTVGSEGWESVCSLLVSLTHRYLRRLGFCHVLSPVACGIGFRLPGCFVAMQ